MVPAIRSHFNKNFSVQKYKGYLNALNAKHPGVIEFRVAETPVFVSKDFTKKMMNACESIIDIITGPTFKTLTKNAIPQNLRVPGENEHTDFIAFDFGVCINEDGEYIPQLIEMQGFPTLFAYQVFLADTCEKTYDIPADYSPYLNGYTRDTYLQLLKDILLNGHASENVILLELFPEKQKTLIDFLLTQEYTGVQTVCLTKLIKEGKKLFYNNNGSKTEIKRIYNRLIFDELLQQPEEVQQKGNILFEEMDVEWCPHPNWFYRISKYTLPFIDHPYVPPTFFLNEIKQLPGDLSNYVLKPLFSFAGQGVVIDVTQNDIDAIEDPENWILQQKVKYADVIETPDVAAKTEIRLFYFWKNGEKKPVAVNNLARLSKGKMIGVNYNKDKEWVGGSLCYFEQ